MPDEENFQISVDEYNSIDRIVRNATDNIRCHNEDTFREWTSLTLGMFVNYRIIIEW